MKKSTRYFLLFYGLFETFVFTGNIFGWTALQYMLRQVGIYRDLCSSENATSTSSNYSEDPTDNASAILDISNGTSFPKTCAEQDRLLNLAYTIGSFCLGFTAVMWGYLLDKWGLRTVRIIINALITAGAILLSLTIRETSFLLFPSLILICLAGVPLRLTNMQIANLFPEHRSTIITLYSGAFSASASVFVFLKYGYDAGLPWEWACFLLVVISVFMLPVTLFVLPAENITDSMASEKGTLFSTEEKEVSAIAPCVWGTYTYFSGSPIVKRKRENETIEKSKDKKEIEKEENANGESSLKNCLLSFSFCFHQYWFCWLLLYTIIYIGTLNLWAERTSTDPNDGPFFAEIYGLLQLTGLFLAPIGGLFMDWSVRRASSQEDADPETQSLQTIRSCFWPMFLTTLLEAIAQACKFFNTKVAIYVSIVAVAFLRGFFLALGTAYLRIRFPAKHFNVLLGFLSTMSAFVTLLQFPLFLWESSSEDVLYVNIYDSVCLGIAFIHPFLLLITPLQRYFLRKEKDARYKLNA